MSRKHNKNYLFLAAFLILLVSSPASMGDAFRAKMVSLFSGAWVKLAQTQVSLNPLSSRAVNDDPVATEYEELKRLKMENQLLSSEVNHLKELLEQELDLLSQGLSESLMAIASEETADLLDSHQKRVLNLFHLQLASLPARVIFRPANSWNSSLWINAGRKNNQALGQEVVVKNSPVVLGDAIVGVIDYVGEGQSRVRLITDSGLNPSVRVEREGILLAKGELYGDSEPLWRMRKQVLHGIGFNYDFPDSAGPARDLRTGEPVGSATSALPILLTNDLLVTTGMDGVFPAGLKAGYVTRIHPLKEGDYFYELEARPAAGDLDELSLVFILPPIGFDRDKQIEDY